MKFIPVLGIIITDFNDNLWTTTSLDVLRFFFLNKITQHIGKATEYLKFD